MKAQRLRHRLNPSKESIDVIMSLLSKQCRHLSVLITLVVAFAISAPVLAATDTALLERATGSEAAVLTDLAQLVNIDSPADYATGVFIRIFHLAYSLRETTFRPEGHCWKYTRIMKCQQIKGIKHQRDDKE